MMSVHMTRLASTKNVKILASRHLVEFEQNAKLKTTGPDAIVLLDSKAIQLSAVMKLDV